MPATLKISCLSEVVLSVHDLPAMREFYMQVMGFPLHSEFSMETPTVNPEGHPTITFLTICELDTPLGRGGHPQLLALIDYRRHVYAKGRFKGHDVSRSTLNHRAFEVPSESFEDQVDCLRELGVELTFSEFPAMNARAMFFSDPEGNVLELIAHQAFDA